jgi:hypothetical protein
MTSNTNHANEDSGMTSTDPASTDPASTGPASASHPARAGHAALSPRQLLWAAGWGPAKAAPPALRWSVNVVAVAGAVLVLLSALIHLKIYGNYEHISVIGPLFLVQGIVGILLALALGVFRRLGLILAGAAFCIATATGLLLSVNFGLFGFKDSLLVPYATSSLIEEFVGGAVLLVAAALVLASRPWRQLRTGDAGRV